jgi:hypothetical protein
LLTMSFLVGYIPLQIQVPNSAVDWPFLSKATNWSLTRIQALLLLSSFSRLPNLCCFHSNASFNELSSLQCDLFLVFTLEQVLCDKDRTPKKVPHVTGLQHACSPWTLAIPQHNAGRTNNYWSQILQAQVMGHLERRVLEVNRKRIKVVKPGSKTSFPSTEVRGTYAPPFHVSYPFKFSR